MSARSADRGGESAGGDHTGSSGATSFKSENPSEFLTGQLGLTWKPTDNASVYFVDRRAPLQDQVFRIDDERTQVLASAFPGFTRDGRIVWGSRYDATTRSWSDRAVVLRGRNLYCGQVDARAAQDWEAAH